MHDLIPKDEQIKEVKKPVKRKRITANISYSIKLRRILEDMINIYNSFIDDPGQGGVENQFEKKVRKKQRLTMYKKIEHVLRENEDAFHKFNIHIVHETPQVRDEVAARVRFRLDDWKNNLGYKWDALLYFVGLTVHRVIDMDYIRCRGTLTIHYVNPPKAKIRTSEDLKKIITCIAILIDGKDISVDYTLIRNLAKSRQELGEMKRGEAVSYALGWKILSSFFGF